VPHPSAIGQKEIRNRADVSQTDPKPKDDGRYADAD